MKVRFQQSGGFVGAPRGCEVDTSALEPEAAREVERLVDAAALTAGTFTTTGARDLKRYEIVVEGPAGPVRVVLDDRTVPPAAAPLLAYLRRGALPGEIA